MNKTKYNQLREEIIKANEDILELKKGCEIEYLNFGEKTKAVVVKYDKSIKPSTFTVFEYSDNEVYSFFEDADNIRKLKIIGRDITLEDVMIDITLNGGSRFNVITYKRGRMRGKMQILREDQKHFITWILGKPLQDQSDETKDFLFDLIVKK